MPSHMTSACSSGVARRRTPTVSPSSTSAEGFVIGSIRPGIPGSGERQVAEGEHQAAVGDAVKVGHLLGDGQRHPAVARRHDGYLGA